MKFYEYQCLIEINATSTDDVLKNYNLTFFHYQGYIFNNNNLIKADFKKNTICGLECYGTNQKNIDSLTSFKIQFVAQKKGLNQLNVQTYFLMEVNDQDSKTMSLEGLNMDFQFDINDYPIECIFKVMQCNSQIYQVKCTTQLLQFLDKTEQELMVAYNKNMIRFNLYLLNITVSTVADCYDTEQGGYCDYNGIQSCSYGYQLENINGINACYYKQSNCQKGKAAYKSMSDCLPCNSSCQVCDETLGCVCQQNQFQSFQNHEIGCIDCIENCLKCTSKYDCQQCQEGYFFDNQISKCTKCNLLNCDRCFGSKICLICQKEYLIQNGLCVKSNLQQQIVSENKEFTIQSKEKRSFYQYSLFWVLVYQTIFQIFVQIFGFHLDNQKNIQIKQQPKSFTQHDRNLGKLNNRQLSQLPLNQVEDQKFQKIKQQSSSLQLEQQQQQTQQQEILKTQFQENLQTEQVATQNYFDQIQIKIDLEKQYQLTNIHEQQSKLNIDNQSNLIAINKDSKVNIDTLGGNNKLKYIQEEQQNDPQSKSQIDLAAYNNEQYDSSEQQKKFIKQNLLLKVIYFHNFLSIFFVFDSKIPRMQRLSIFYLRVVHALSISSIFGQYCNSGEMILTCFVSSIIVSICISIIMKIYTIKLVGKYLYSGIFLGLLGYYIYIVSSILAGKHSSYTNDIIGWFFVMLIFDLILVSGLLAIFQLLLVNHMVSNTIPKNKIIQKLFNFLSLENVLRNLNL
ncbi:hypothetical protein ABPG74_009283 [Tetrahymena malaccensis]